MTDQKLIRLATYASVTAAAILITAKIFGYWMTHSVSLQASLIDSLLDAAASLINMIAVAHALRPADKEHRFGHGKAESLAGLAQSIFIGGSSAWLLHEIYNRLQEPAPIHETSMGIGIMTFSIVLTMGLITFQKHVVDKTGSIAITADRLHYKSDLLINATVIISLLGAQYLHIQWLDPLFGLLIGGYILWTAWTIICHAFNVLMDAELSDEERDRIKDILHSHPKVRGFDHLRTRTSGLETFIEMHLSLESSISFQEADEIASDIEKNIMEAFPHSQVMIRLRLHDLGL